MRMAASWRVSLLWMTVLLTLQIKQIECQVEPFISYIVPRYGGMGGGIMVTIYGGGFAAEFFSQGPDISHLGNTVVFVSDYQEFPCEMVIDGSNSEVITCYTSGGAPYGTYFPRVTVNGKDIPLDNTCGYSYNCQIRLGYSDTPTIRSISPLSGPPGTLLTMNGRIQTSRYGSMNISTNGREEYIRRAWVGGENCALKGDNDVFYGLALQGTTSSYGHMTCKVSEFAKIGNINASYLISGGFGRSVPDSHLYRVSRNGQIFMFQTYAEVYSIFPESGSTKGGTVITINGINFDNTRTEPVVFVGGSDCNMLTRSETKITCETRPAPDNYPPVFPGNRGIWHEVWKGTYEGMGEVGHLNHTVDGYMISHLDEAHFRDILTEADRFTSKLRGFFQPPFDGQYQFLIKADDTAQLYLSIDTDPTNKQLIAECDRYRNSYYSSPAQASERIELSSSESYFLEVYHREFGDENFAQVAAKYFNISLIEEMAGTIQQEEQRIRMRSDLVKESQNITISGFNDQNRTDHIQEVDVVRSADSPFHAQFRLCVYDVCTVTLLYGSSSGVVQTALNDLPVMQSPEHISVNRTSITDGYKYIVIFSSARGYFPDIEYTMVSGYLQINVTTIQEGVPSGSVVSLFMDGVPAPIVAKNATAAQMEASLKGLFTTRCPSYLANPSFSFLHFDMENQNGVAGHLRSLWTNSKEAFCGQGVLYGSVNMYILHANYHGSVSLQMNPYFCMAFKGYISSTIGVLATFKFLSGSSTSRWATLPNVIPTGVTNEWIYTCQNLDARLKDLYDLVEEVTLTHLRLNNAGGTYYVDEVFFGSAATISTETDQKEAYKLRLVSRPQGYSIVDVDVTKTDDSYKVALTAAPGGYGFSLFTVDDKQKPPGANVSVDRLSSASPPIMGTFDLSLWGQTVSGIPVDISSDDLEAIIETIDGIGLVTVTRGGSLYYFWITIRFDNAPGDIEEFQVNSTATTGVNIHVYVQTLTDGHYMIDPLSGEMLQTVHDKPQVTVLINDVPSKCSGNCSFQWLDDSTPNITNSTPYTGPPGTELTITGTGFSNVAADNIVTIGGMSCSVLESTATSINCSTVQGPNGEHLVIVHVKGKGYAQNSNNHSFTYETKITGIKPTSSGIGGCIPLTISGYGFGDTSRVLIDFKPCDIEIVSPLEIVCIVPVTSTEASVLVKVQQIGVDDVTAETPFTYNVSLTPGVSTIAPQTTYVSGGTLEINGTGFGIEQNAVLMLGSTVLNITSFSDTQVTANLTSCPPGLHKVKLVVGTNGAALNSQNILPTINCDLHVSKVYPMSGSLHGGTTLTLIGRGFTPDTEVKVGEHECEIILSTATNITCMIVNTRKIHKVNNEGIHPVFNKYYYWKPQHLRIEVGDMVRWDWSFPFFITSMKVRVEQTLNLTSTLSSPGGFSSGQEQSAGSFVNEFNVPNIYYYWSGFVDRYKTTKFHGSIQVVPKQSYAAKVTVMLGGHEATYNTSSDMNDTADSGENQEIISPSSECEDIMPTGNDSSVFSFAFWSCRTPYVNSISIQNGTTVDDIEIEGAGFSTVNYQNEIRFGDYVCLANSSEDSVVTCRIDPLTMSAVGVPQFAAFLVQNLGYTSIRITEPTKRTFALLPLVTSLTPTEGSRGGWTSLSISGTGFVDSMYSDLIEVTVGGYFCTIQEVTYMSIACLTPVSLSNQEVAIDVRVTPGNGMAPYDMLKVPASCAKNTCSFRYTDAATPSITAISPSSVTGEQTTVTISGLQLGDQLSDVSVKMMSSEEHICNVTASSGTEIQCVITNLPVGVNKVIVDVAGRGRAVHPVDGDVILQSEATITAISPISGSVHGGTSVTLTGNGFLSDVAVKMDGYDCRVVYLDLAEVVCISPAHTAASVQITITSNKVTFPAPRFTYNDSISPSVTSVVPSSGIFGINVTVIGTNFGNSNDKNEVMIGDVPCEVLKSDTNEIICSVGSNFAGTYRLYVNVKYIGISNDDQTFRYEMNASSVVPNSGSLAGNQTVTVTGTGFDDGLTVTICGGECVKSSFTATEYVCITPPGPGSVTSFCDVVVTLNTVTHTLRDAYKYDSTKTPSITGVNPIQGGTGGGTRVTINGLDFGNNLIKRSSTCNSEVTMGGTPCEVVSWSETQIICETEAHSPSERVLVRVETGCNGMALQIDANFHFVDVWSSVFTWGGESLPGEGEIVVIQEGQTVLFDTVTPILKMVLIQGGELIFYETDVELKADNILIVGGGVLQIGTEETPFQHNAVITLYGHQRSKELPIYGTKALVVRDGTLDLHGLPIPATWTRLDRTANSGDNQIVLMDEVNWKAGDEIAIASTGGFHSQSENELGTIASIDRDNKTITLQGTLKHTHLGVSETIGGRNIDFRAEIGLLSHNVIVRGNKDKQLIENVEPCPDGFHAGEFAVLPCFEGRFSGKNNNKFGAQLIFHTPDSTKTLTTCRMEYIELYHVGQAFRIGRHPVHFHLLGSQSHSYLRGCSIHDSFNRAVNIQGTHSLTVERTVLYNILGGGMVLEDGIETMNVFQYNLAIFVSPSSSLMNDEVTPASFFITNPHNFVRHNAVAGGSHLGYWFRMNEHPTGPSARNYICPRSAIVGEFFNNTAHSFGWYGVWIFPIYHPREGGTCYSSTPINVSLQNTFVWNSRKAIELVNVGPVQVKNLTSVNNKEAGFEGNIITEGERYTEKGPLIEDSLFAGYAKTLPSQGCTNAGIVVPYKYGLMIRNIHFENFDQNNCAAFSTTRIAGTCTSMCGGFTYKTSGLTFTAVNNRVRNEWHWEAIFEDLDGTFCGSESCRVLPFAENLPPSCAPFPSSVGYPAYVCPPDVQFIRFAFNNPTPYYVRYKSINFTNDYGSTVHYWKGNAITHTNGWHTNFIVGQEYSWRYEDTPVLTNISYSGVFYNMQPGDYVIIKQLLANEPDSFRINGQEINATVGELNPNINFHGDWYYNDETGYLHYLISYSERPPNQISETVVKDMVVNLEATRCYFRGCKEKKEEEIDFILTKSRPQTAVLWSDTTSWPNDTLPVNDVNVTIPKGVWIVADTAVPRIDKLIIYGALEFDHGPSAPFRNFTVSANDIIIIGGRLIIGWEDSAFLGQAEIILRGRRLGLSETETFLPGTNIPINLKTLAVYGALDLHGIDIGVSWTKLGSTASPGENALTLAESVTWEVGSEIVLSPTSYDAWETETFVIIALSDDGLTITLNDTLKYRHIVHLETIGERTIEIAAEVGLFTRNIKIIGEDDGNMFSDSYGGRIIVSQGQVNSSFYTGFARLNNVEFVHTGHEGYVHFPDIRFSLTYLNSVTVSNDRPSYVAKCAFHNGFSPAVGAFGANGLIIEDNVIHHTFRRGIETKSLITTIRRNLIVLVIWKGSYQDRREDAGISGIHARGLVLQNNVVSGSEGVAYRIHGIECGSDSGPFGNEAHSSLLGFVIFPTDAIPMVHCVQISNYVLWKCRGVATYYNNKLPVVYSNIVAAENGLAFYSQIIGPSAVDHLFEPKYCEIRDSVIIGATSSFDCAADQLKLNENWGIPNAWSNGNHIGFGPCAFIQGSNNAPVSPMIGISSYPAIKGITTVRDVTFAHFKDTCGLTDVMITSDPTNDDGQHPVQIWNSNITNSNTTNYFFLHRPNIGKVNPSDCMDMDCDGLKKILIKDEDGSMLGSKGALISQSEFEWNGDPRRGLGDYRIPTELLMTQDGSRINVSDIAPFKGIIRNAQCQYRSAWQGYECHDIDYEMLIIESLDDDTETRRVSPVAILGDGYLDLINGPQDHGWCYGYTCRKRLSTFMAIVAIGKDYLIKFTSTNPQSMRFFLLNSDINQAITVRIPYHQSNRRDVYLGDQYVKAENARFVDGKYLIDPPTFEGQYIPNVSSDAPSGTNYFDRFENALYILIRGNTPITIRTKPSFIISFQLPALTADEFFGENLIHNLALFFYVSPDKIRIVNVVRETTTRKKRDAATTVDVEISDPPAQNQTNTTTDPITTEVAKSLALQFQTVAQLGNLDEVTNMTVLGVSITAPLPDTNSSDWSDIANTTSPLLPLTIVRADRFSIYTQPEPKFEANVFTTQPKIIVLDEQDQQMSLLGTADQPWRVTAFLRAGSNPSAQLRGHVDIPFVDGWANFTDLMISQFETDFVIDFNLTEPTSGRILSVSSQSITIQRRQVESVVKTTAASAIANITMAFYVELHDSFAKMPIDNITWRGHTWTVTVELNTDMYPLGTLQGTTQVAFDTSVGIATFDSLFFTSRGVYFLIFRTVSSPAEYDFYEEIKVEVSASTNIRIEETLLVEVIFDEVQYTDVIYTMSDAERFGIMVMNSFARLHSDTQFTFVATQSGSIIVQFTVSGNTVAVNNSLQSVCSTVEKNPPYAFNNITLHLASSVLVNGAPVLGLTCGTINVTTSSTGIPTTTTTTSTPTTTTTTSTPTTTTTTSTPTTTTTASSPTSTTTPIPTTISTATTDSGSLSTTGIPMDSRQLLTVHIVIIIIAAALVFPLAVFIVFLFYKCARRKQPSGENHISGRLRTHERMDNIFKPEKWEERNEHKDVYLQDQSRRYYWWHSTGVPLEVSHTTAHGLTNKMEMPATYFHHSSRLDTRQIYLDPSTRTRTPVSTVYERTLYPDTPNVTSEFRPDGESSISYYY